VDLGDSEKTSIIVKQLNKSVLSLGVKHISLRKKVEVLSWLIGAAWVAIGIVAIKVFQ